MDKKTFVSVSEARSEDQKKVLEQIIKDDVCPFCTENLTKYHKQPILKEGEYWLLTTNQWPYKNSKQHLLAIHKAHIEHISELTPEASKELIDLFVWATKEYSIQSGGIGMRFGTPQHVGASVKHLHAHLLEPDRESPTYETLRFKMG